MAVDFLLGAALILVGLWTLGTSRKKSIAQDPGTEARLLELRSRIAAAKAEECTLRLKLDACELKEYVEQVELLRRVAEDAVSREERAKAALRAVFEKIGATKEDLEELIRKIEEPENAE